MPPCTAPGHVGAPRAGRRSQSVERRCWDYCAIVASVAGVTAGGVGAACRGPRLSRGGPAGPLKRRGRLLRGPVSSVRRGGRLRRLQGRRRCCRGPAPEALGSGDSSPPGEEPVSEVNCLQDWTHMLWEGPRPAPQPGPGGRGRGSRSGGGGAPGPGPGRRAARAQSSSSSLAAAVGTRSCTLKQPTKKLMMDRYRCCLRGALWK